LRARLRAANQLGREIPELALDEAWGGQHAGAIPRARQAEVGQLDRAARAQQKVLRRNVAMNDGDRRAVGGVTFVGRGQPAQSTDADEGGERPRDTFVA
jgi:hypothetical protein